MQLRPFPFHACPSPTHFPRKAPLALFFPHSHDESESADGKDRFAHVCCTQVPVSPPSLDSNHLLIKTPHSFQAVLWGGTGISLGFLAFRIFVRISSFRRIYVDDILVLVAWLLFLASAIIWQSQQTAIYDQFAEVAGTMAPTPEWLAAEKTLLRAEAATITMYYTSLWIVKLSFLLFFRRLGQNVKGHTTWWWCVLAFTVATWFTCIGSISFNCLLRPLQYIYSKFPGPMPKALRLIIDRAQRNASPQLQGTPSGPF